MTEPEKYAKNVRKQNGETHEDAEALDIARLVDDAVLGHVGHDGAEHDETDGDDRNDLFDDIKVEELEAVVGAELTDRFHGFGGGSVRGVVVALIAVFELARGDRRGRQDLRVRVVEIEQCESDENEEHGGR